MGTETMQEVHVIEILVRKGFDSYAFLQSFTLALNPIFELKGAV